MNFLLVLFFHVVIFQAAHSDFSGVDLSNDIDGGVQKKSGGGGVEKIGYVARQKDGSMASNIQSISVEPHSITKNGQALNKQPISQEFIKNTNEGKYTKYAKSKYAENETKKSSKKQKKNRKKYQGLDRFNVQKNIQTGLVDEQKDDIKEPHHITRKNSLDTNEMSFKSAMLADSNMEDQRDKKNIALNKMKRDKKERVGKDKLENKMKMDKKEGGEKDKLAKKMKMDKKERVKKDKIANKMKIEEKERAVKDEANKKVEPVSKKPITLNHKEYDEADNFIDDNDEISDWEMKRLKKDIWLQNLIPKSNKFLYNNKKYHAHLIGIDDIKKHGHKHHDAVINHDRHKRSVLSSIFVQMPRDDDDSSATDEYLGDSEDPREKKSKGSTTVCLEIKSDPTKPPSTICGPEIKPISPLDPHMYELGSNQNYVPNNFYYTEPQADKTVWSLSPLHDPNYYSTVSNYKYQSTNRENSQHNHKHGAINREGLDKNKLPPSSQVTTQDKDKISMTQHALSSEDSSKTLNRMPLAANNVVQDSDKTGHAQSPRTFLSENSEDVSGIIRNNFKDLDLQLDGEMSTNVNSYLNPGGFEDVQFSPVWNTPQLGDSFENRFLSEQMSSYPFNNYDASGGIWKSTEQALGEGSQLGLSNEQLVGLNEKPKQTISEASPETMTSGFKNVELSEQVEPKEANDSTDQSVTAESSFRGAYEYYPDRGYPYRPTTYPYVPSRPYPYNPTHRPYIYDRYDPYCRSGRCRSAQQDAERSAQLLSDGELSNDAMTTLQYQGRNIQNLEGVTDNLAEISMSPRGVQPSQFRGEVYYGRPYPYRPPYEYQGSSSYPYSSRPYPYSSSSYPYSGSSYPYSGSYDRPHYGSSYPYDPNCRTADGRSCREAEEARSANDDPKTAPSPYTMTYIHPNFPVIQPAVFKGPQSDENNEKLRSMGMTVENEPAAFNNPSSAFQFRSMDSENLQETSPLSTQQDAVLGNPLPLFRTSVPVSPIQTVPAGLACNVIHAPVIPQQPLIHTPIISQQPLIANIGGLGGIGGGHAHIGHLGGLQSGIGTHGIGLNAISTVGNHGLHHKLTAGSGLVSVNSVLSGVGTHGIGGSSGLIQHHGLLGEKTPDLRNIEENTQEETNKERANDSENSPSESDTVEATSKTDTKAKPSVEELKTKIAEKLKAAEEKLRSSKNSILEKINKTVEKDKKNQENEKTEGAEVNGEVAADPELGETFSQPAIVQFPTGGRISINSGRSNTNGDARTVDMGILTGSSGTPIINMRTPLGGSITYDSPLFRNGFFGRGSFPFSFMRPNNNGFRSADVQQCNCDPGTATCICPVSNVNTYPLNRNANGAYIGVSPDFQRSMSPQMYGMSYVSNNGQMLGLSPIEKSVAYNTPLSSVSLEAGQNVPMSPCMAKQLLGSSINENVQIAQQPIVSPCAAARSQDISYSAQPLGTIQYQQNVNGMSEVPQNRQIASPMVGFASLSEMKERENQLKESYPGYDFNLVNEKDKPNYNTYEELYKESIEKQSNCDPTFKNMAGNSDMNTNNVKVTPLKKPSDLKALEKLPSKLLAKTLKPPTPILKLPLPKPFLKNSNLRSTQKEPC